jgi:hypothetical protein
MVMPDAGAHTGVYHFRLITEVRHEEKNSTPRQTV